MPDTARDVGLGDLLGDHSGGHMSTRTDDLRDGASHRRMPVGVPNLLPSHVRDAITDVLGDDLLHGNINILRHVFRLDDDDGLLLLSLLPSNEITRLIFVLSINTVHLKKMYFLYSVCTGKMSEVLTRPSPILALGMTDPAQV